MPLISVYLLPSAFIYLFIIPSFPLCPFSSVIPSSSVYLPCDSNLTFFILQFSSVAKCLYLFIYQFFFSSPSRFCSVIQSSSVYLLCDSDLTFSIHQFSSLATVCIHSSIISSFPLCPFSAVIQFSTLNLLRYSNLAFSIPQFASRTNSFSFIYHSFVIFLLLLPASCFQRLHTSPHVSFERRSSLFLSSSLCLFNLNRVFVQITKISKI